MLKELSYKAQFGHPFSRGKVARTQNIGKGIIGANVLGNYRRNQDMDSAVYFNPDGYHPQYLVTRAVNTVENSAEYITGVPKMLGMKRPKFMVSSKLDKVTDEVFRDIIRPRLGLLDSEKAALNALKRSVGIDKLGLQRLPMQDTLNDRAHKLYESQLQANAMMNTIGAPSGEDVINNRYPFMLGENEGDEEDPEAIAEKVRDPKFAAYLEKLKGAGGHVLKAGGVAMQLGGALIGAAGGVIGAVLPFALALGYHAVRIGVNGMLYGVRFAGRGAAAVYRAARRNGEPAPLEGGQGEEEQVMLPENLQPGQFNAELLMRDPQYAQILAADPNFAPGPNVRAPNLLDEIEEEEKMMIDNSKKGRMRNGQLGKKYKIGVGAAGLLGVAAMAGGIQPSLAGNSVIQAQFQKAMDLIDGFQGNVPPMQMDGLPIAGVQEGVLSRAIQNVQGEQQDAHVKAYEEEMDRAQILQEERRLAIAAHDEILKRLNMTHDRIKEILPTPGSDKDVKYLRLSIERLETQLSSSEMELRGLDAQIEDLINSMAPFGQFRHIKGIENAGLALNFLSVGPSAAQVAEQQVEIDLDEEYARQFAEEQRAREAQAALDAADVGDGEQLLRGKDIALNQEQVAQVDGAGGPGPDPNPGPARGPINPENVPALNPDNIGGDQHLADVQNAVDFNYRQDHPNYPADQPIPVEAMHEGLLEQGMKELAAANPVVEAQPSIPVYAPYGNDNKKLDSYPDLYKDNVLPEDKAKWNVPAKPENLQGMVKHAEETKKKIEEKRLVLSKEKFMQAQAEKFANRKPFTQGQLAWMKNNEDAQHDLLQKTPINKKQSVTALAIKFRDIGEAQPGHIYKLSLYYGLRDAGLRVPAEIIFHERNGVGLVQASKAVERALSRQYRDSEVSSSDWADLVHAYEYYMIYGQTPLDFVQDWGGHLFTEEQVNQLFTDPVNFDLDSVKENLRKNPDGSFAGSGSKYEQKNKPK